MDIQSEDDNSKKPTVESDKAIGSISVPLNEKKIAESLVDVSDMTKSSSPTNQSKKSLKKEFTKNQECGVNSKSTSLSFRNDVVNKTLLRSIKKYYTDLFKAKSDFFLVKNKKDRKKIYYECIKKFTQTELFDQNSQFFTAEELEDVTMCMAILVKPEYMLQISLCYQYIRFKKIYEGCIYHYSRAYFDKIVQNQTFMKIFSNFVKLGHFETMTKTDTTLMRNPEFYIERVNEIILKTKCEESACQDYGNIVSGQN